MLEGYWTVSGPALAEQVIDKSRFIASIAVVKSAEEAAGHMRLTQETYPNARHYVYAYRLYAGRLEKASDDGEPQGTGGRPVLDLLQHRQVWNVQIIVVRYFGGILLGTGGLTRAYGGTARSALNQVDIVRLVPHFGYGLVVPYSLYEPLKYGLKQHGWEYGQEQFLETITLEVYVTEEEALQFENWVDEFSNGHVRKEKISEILKPQRE